ncbi:MAG: hypothetical protein GWO02_10990, partial [Gammaproteobacteria bacterium]|nr:hypothetical protein [Gammaproteobacteria bacterium]
AFAWGRRYVVDADAVMQVAGLRDAPKAPPTLDEIIATREELLTAYQDRGYARRYRALVDRALKIEGRVLPGSRSLTEAVARHYAKL